MSDLSGVVNEQKSLIAKLKSENSQLRAKCGHLEQELSMLRSREMCADDIADYTEDRAKLVAEIKRLKTEQLRVAQAYDPLCEQYDFNDQIAVMKCAADHMEGLREAAEYTRDDPEGNLRDLPDRLIGEIENQKDQIEALQSEVRELVKVLREVCDDLRLMEMREG